MYKHKYLKYKEKYLTLKNRGGGVNYVPVFIITFNQGSMLPNEVESLHNIENMMSKIGNSELVVLNMQESSNTSVEDKINEFLTKNGSYSRIFKNTKIQIGLGKLKLFVWSINDGSISKFIVNEQIPPVDSYCSLTQLGKGFIYCFIKNRSTSNNLNIIFSCAHLPSDAVDIASRNACLEKLNNDIQNNIKKYGVTNYVKFVSGDLNYRTTDEQPYTKDSKKHNEETNEQKKIKSLTCDTIISSECSLDKTTKTCTNIHGPNDQLTKYLNNNKMFNEFPITFCPSCRFDEKDTTGQRYYDPKRFPSFCDRIIHRCENCDLQDSEYYSHVISNNSDHNAVLLKTIIVPHSI